MAEEKPLFLIDIDRAIDGLQASARKNSAAEIAIEPLIMYSVDLANALDGAGLDALSEITNELAQCFNQHHTQACLVIDDLVTLVRSDVAFHHPSVNSENAFTLDQFNQAKELFAKKILQIKKGLPITNILDAGSKREIDAQVDSAMGQGDILKNTDKDSQAFAMASSADETANLFVPESVPEFSQKLSPELSALTQSVPDSSGLSPLSELGTVFVPRSQDDVPATFASPMAKEFSFPEGLTRPLDRANSLDYSGSQRYLDKHFSLDRAHNLNRMQVARSLVTKTDNWNGVELDYLLGREQDELTKVGQQSLRHIFENLTDELLIDEVYADPEIAQQLVTIISILPPCPSIFAVQQELMIFIDLDHVSLSQDHIMAAGRMMAEIAGSLEIHHEGVRLACPSSLLRMPMAYFTRHGQYYATSAIQYLGEEGIAKAVDSKVDALGEVMHPARLINLRVGHQEYSIYAHEFLGVQNMNIHQNIPQSLQRPHWLAGMALDGMNHVYSWVALDRFAK